MSQQPSSSQVEAKLFYFVSFCAVLSLYIFIYCTSLEVRVPNSHGNTCLGGVVPVNRLLFIEESVAQPKPDGSNIFFLETSCSSSGPANLNARQACAVESAARFHANWSMFVLFAAPRTQPETKVMSALQSYNNVFIRNIDVHSYAVNSPIEQLVSSGRFYHTKFFNYHLSDLLRFLTLWKFGGLFLDLDVIVLKNFESLGQNYAGAEGNNSLSSSGVNFAPSGIGHEVVNKCLEELAVNFDGTKWNRNGPALLTRVLNEWCGQEKNVSIAVEDLEECSPMRILPIKTFLPINWNDHTYYFNPKKLDKVLKAANQSYSIHIYNHLNAKRKIAKGSNVPYDYLARKYCPRVYAMMDDTW